MAKGYKHIAGAEVRGEGPYALLGAIVLQAVADLDPSIADLDREPALPQQAHAWLQSEVGQWALDELDIPHQPFMEALNEGRRLLRGTGLRACWRPDVA